LLWVSLLGPGWVSLLRWRSIPLLLRRIAGTRRPIPLLRRRRVALGRRPVVRLGGLALWRARTGRRRSRRIAGANRLGGVALWRRRPEGLRLRLWLRLWLWLWLRLGLRFGRGRARCRALGVKREGHLAQWSVGFLRDLVYLAVVGRSRRLVRRGLRRRFRVVTRWRRLVAHLLLYLLCARSYGGDSPC
jgi:hypothetical protein